MTILEELAKITNQLAELIGEKPIDPPTKGALH